MQIPTAVPTAVPTATAAAETPALPLNLPDIHAEVSAAFARYEAALVANDVAVLDELFWDSPHTIRYGVGEQLVGIEEIRAFRAARSPVGLDRTLRRTFITTFGRDLATAMTEFTRPGFAVDGRALKVGRQSQTWVRTDAGWRVVAAHVSVVPAAG